MSNHTIGELEVILKDIAEQGLIKYRRHMHSIDALRQAVCDTLPRDGNDNIWGWLDQVFTVRQDRDNLEPQDYEHKYQHNVINIMLGCLTIQDAYRVIGIDYEQRIIRLFDFG